MPRSTERSTELILCTLCTPVDRAVDRPSPPVNRVVDWELTWPAPIRRVAPLSSDLCATFFHLLYLLSPYKYQRRSWTLCYWSSGLVRAFSSRRTSEWKRPQKSERWLPDGRIFGTEDDFKKIGCSRCWLQESWMWRKLNSRRLDMAEADFKKVGCGGGSRLDSESLWTSRGRCLVVRTCVIILMSVKFWPLHIPYIV